MTSAENILSETLTEKRHRDGAVSDPSSNQKSSEDTVNEWKDFCQVCLSATTTLSLQNK